MSLGFLWLDVKVVNKKTIFLFNVIFFIPENEISNSAKVFLAFISFHYYFTKTNDSAGSGGPGGSAVC